MLSALRSHFYVAHSMDSCDSGHCGPQPGLARSASPEALFNLPSLFQLPDSLCCRRKCWTCSVFLQLPSVFLRRLGPYPAAGQSGIWSHLRSPHPHFEVLLGTCGFGKNNVPLGSGFLAVHGVSHGFSHEWRTRGPSAVCDERNRAYCSSYGVLFAVFLTGV